MTTIASKSTIRYKRIINNNNGHIRGYIAYQLITDVDGGKYYHFGWSLLNPADAKVFNRETGKDLALARLINRPKVQCGVKMAHHGMGISSLLSSISGRLRASNKFTEKLQLVIENAKYDVTNFHMIEIFRSMLIQIEEESKWFDSSICH